MFEFSVSLAVTRRPSDHDVGIPEVFEIFILKWRTA
jgi:hypothetical protein